MLLWQIYPFAFEHLFQEPQLLERNVFDAEVKEVISVENAVYVKKPKELMDLSRPSDFRLKAIYAVAETTKSSTKPSLVNNQKNKPNDQQNTMKQCFEFFLNCFSESIEW